MKLHNFRNTFGAKPFGRQRRRARAQRENFLTTIALLDNLLDDMTNPEAVAAMRRHLLVTAPLSD